MFTFLERDRCDETFHRRHHKMTFLRMFPAIRLDVMACMAVCGYIYRR